MTRGTPPEATGVPSRLPAPRRERIRLDAIVFDAGTQVRAAISEETVVDYAALMESGTKFPPVMLFTDGIHYYMADGFHRGHAAQRIGAVDIPAEIMPGTRADALWFALGANRTNGARLTCADKRQAILLALKEWPEKSGHVIAEQIGVNQRYFAEIKAQVSATTHLPSRVTGKDGKSYPASRTSAPKAPEPEPDEPEAEPEPGPDYTGHSTARRTPTAQSNGMQFARIAIMKMEEIQDNDLERQQAFTHVRRWLDARET